MAATFILRTPEIRARALRHIAELPDDDGQCYVVRIDAHRPLRSRAQLALLWVRHHALAKAVAEHTGYSAGDIHEYLKERFLPGRLVEIGGHIVRRCTTRTLSVRQMSEFMAQIEAWAATELDIRLPSPDDMLMVDDDDL